MLATGPKLLLLLLLSAYCLFASGDAKTPSIYDFNLPDINGKMISLAPYKGKVLVLVNVASKSIYANQCAALQTLYDDYKAQGLVVAVFPSNDFGNQEPEPDNKIKAVYSDTYHLTFPVFSKVATRGDDVTPLFHYLSKEANPNIAGDVHWNFTKFLIGRDGQLLARFDPDVTPDNPDFLVAVENALKAKPGAPATHQTPPSPARTGSGERRSRDPE